MRHLVLPEYKFFERPSESYRLDNGHPINHLIKDTVLFNQNGGYPKNISPANDYAAGITFSGSPVWDVYGINVASGASVEIPDSLGNPSGGNFAIRVIFRADTWPGGFTILFEYNTGGTGRDILVTVDTSGNLSFYHIGANEGSISISTGMTTLSIWDFVMSRIGSSVRFYVNGVDKGGITESSTTTNANRTWSLGRNPSGGASNFDGSYILFQSWVRGLSASEVIELYDKRYLSIEPNKSIVYSSAPAATLDISVSETISLAESSTTIADLLKALSEAISVLENLSTSLSTVTLHPDVLTENIAVVESVFNQIIDVLVKYQLSESIAVSEALTLILNPLLANVNELISVVENIQSVIPLLGLNLGENVITITENLILRFPQLGLHGTDIISVTEFVKIFLDSLNVHIGDDLVITETLTTLLPTLAIHGTESITLTEFISVVKIVVRQMEISLSDTIILAESIVVKINALFSRVSDAISLYEATQLLFSGFSFAALEHYYRRYLNDPLGISFIEPITLGTQDSHDYELYLRRYLNDPISVVNIVRTVYENITLTESVTKEMWLNLIESITLIESQNAVMNSPSLTAQYFTILAATGEVRIAVYTTGSFRDFYFQYKSTSAHTTMIFNWDTFNDSYVVSRGSFASAGVFSVFTNGTRAPDSIDFTTTPGVTVFNYTGLSNGVFSHINYIRTNRSSHNQDGFLIAYRDGNPVDAYYVAAFQPL